MKTHTHIHIYIDIYIIFCLYILTKNLAKTKTVWNEHSTYQHFELLCFKMLTSI